MLPPTHLLPTYLPHTRAHQGIPHPQTVLSLPRHSHSLLCAYHSHSLLCAHHSHSLLRAHHSHSLLRARYRDPVDVFLGSANHERTEIRIRMGRKRKRDNRKSGDNGEAAPAQPGNAPLSNPQIATLFDNVNFAFENFLQSSPAASGLSAPAPTLSTPALPAPTHTNVLAMNTPRTTEGGGSGEGETQQQ
ncbi:hypothetical protein DM02DRAFT_683063 [Periconia macrospinosa]|uniref:Uncharacterized protein n=1 Tax=Periconia macrospinosa TaxID=97972 RepID=A0A2V1DK07_9PLEO|nr:hypothetical protein DM02DRAFT_683063 [Periconia macrospinosa]